MSLPDPRQTSQVCPRCNLVFPRNQTVCSNCGLSVAYTQSGNVSDNMQMLSSDSGQFKGAGGLLFSSMAQGRERQGSSLGISQGRGGQGSSLGISQAREVQTPSGVPAARMVQTPMSGMPVARMVQEPSPPNALLPFASGAQKERPVRKNTTLLYFITVILVIMIVAVTGLHAAGVSPASLLPHKAVTPAITYAVPKVTPLFADSFVNDASGWNLQSSPGNYLVSVGNGMLTLEIDKNKLLWELLPGTISYRDFTLTVNTVLAKGDQNNGYGLYIRGTAGRNSDLDTYYRFELYGDGSYAIFKGTVDQNGTSIATKVVNYTLSSAIQKQGKPNHIILIARGAALSFVVNGQLLTTITDASYPSGSIALFASNLPEAKPGIQVQFSQLALYPGQVSKAS